MLFASLSMLSMDTTTISSVMAGDQSSCSTDMQICPFAYTCSFTGMLPTNTAVGGSIGYLPLISRSSVNSSPEYMLSGAPCTSMVMLVVVKAFSWYSGEDSLRSTLSSFMNRAFILPSFMGAMGMKRIKRTAQRDETNGRKGEDETCHAIGKDRTDDRISEDCTDDRAIDGRIGEEDRIGRGCTDDRTGEEDRSGEGCAEVRRTETSNDEPRGTHHSNNAVIQAIYTRNVNFFITLSKTSQSLAIHTLSKQYKRDLLALLCSSLKECVDMDVLDLLTALISSSRELLYDRVFKGMVNDIIAYLRTYSLEYNKIVYLKGKIRCCKEEVARSIEPLDRMNE